MNFEVGAWYLFIFNDHAKDTENFDEIQLVLAGKVERVTDYFIHVVYWDCVSRNGDIAVENANKERAVIAKGTIIKKRKLAF